MRFQPHSANGVECSRSQLCPAATGCWFRDCRGGGQEQVPHSTLEPRSASHPTQERTGSCDVLPRKSQGDAALKAALTSLTRGRLAGGGVLPQHAHQRRGGVSAEPPETCTNIPFLQLCGIRGGLMGRSHEYDHARRAFTGVCTTLQVFFFWRMLDALNEPYATAKMLSRRHATLPCLEACLSPHSLCF